MFLNELKKAPTSIAAKKVGVPINKIYAERRKDPEFADKWQEIEKNPRPRISY